MIKQFEKDTQTDREIDKERQRYLFDHASSICHKVYSAFQITFKVHINDYLMQRMAVPGNSVNILSQS